MTRIAIELHSAEDSDLEALLGDRLYEFNVEATGFTDGEVLFCSSRDIDGSIVAGLSGHTWGGTCEIKQVWVHEKLRGQGVGNELMRYAEAEAIRRKCTQILLTTHSFQAMEFYEKLGFKKLAVVPEYPKGYKNVLYIKQLQFRSDND